MQIDLSLRKPTPTRVRQVSRVSAAVLVLVAVICLTLAVELAFAERKFALFGGGFGASRTLDRPVEIAGFLLGVVAAQTLLALAFYRILRRLHRHWADSRLFLINFFCIASGAGLALLLAKYQALSYFSDAISLQIVRNLGGGSLSQALLYGLQEASLIIGGIALAVLGYVSLLWLLRRYWRDAVAVEDQLRLSGGQWLAAIAGLAALLFSLSQMEDVRHGFLRINATFAAKSLFGAATDFDRDGYSFFSSPVDGAPFDGARHPYALDIPGNGVDEDGFGGDFPVLAAREPEPSPVIAGAKPHVVLIVLESVRGDVLGKRIAGRSVAPLLERMATEGSSAPAAYSHVGFTTFSLHSLFTGLHAPHDDRQSLFRDFEANGYDLGVFSGQPEDFGDTAAMLRLRRARHYVDAGLLKEERATPFTALASLVVDGKVLLREFDRRLGRREDWARPQFLYFNFQSAHFPYHFPGMDQILPGRPIPRREIGADNREWLQNTYWNAVAYNDRLIGMLLDRLKRLGVYENTLIVITSDHGESLFEDGFLGHGHAITREQLHIPLIINRPGLDLSGAVGLVDMRRIILGAAGARLSPAAPSESVLLYLGDLDRPAAIGEVDARGQFRAFNLTAETWFTSGSDAWRPYRELSPDAPERQRLNTLINRWMAERIASRPKTTIAAR